MAETGVYIWDRADGNTMEIEIEFLPAVSIPARVGRSPDLCYDAEGCQVEILGHKLLGPYPGKWLAEFKDFYRKDWLFSELVDDELTAQA